MTDKERQRAIEDVRIIKEVCGVRGYFDDNTAEYKLGFTAGKVCAIGILLDALEDELNVSSVSCETIDDFKDNERTVI